MSDATNVAIREESIDLDQFLKLAGAVGSGGEAKYVIGEGMVRINDEPESRRRRKLSIGDTVSVTDIGTFRVTARSD